MRAVVLRDGKLEVRETADPVPGPGELLIKPLSAAICASDVHYMDHPNSAARFVVGLRPRHDHGPRVHRRGGRTRPGLLG